MCGPYCWPSAPLVAISRDQGDTWVEIGLPSGAHQLESINCASDDECFVSQV
jgi:hypothetical protein